VYRSQSESDVGKEARSRRRRLTIQLLGRIQDFFHLFAVAEIEVRLPEGGGSFEQSIGVLAADGLKGAE